VCKHTGARLSRRNDLTCHGDMRLGRSAMNFGRCLATYAIAYSLHSLRRCVSITTGSIAIAVSSFQQAGVSMYELILTVMVTFGQPVLVLDGHGVSMVTRRYEVAVQGFPTKDECVSFAGYKDLEESLTGTFGADTKIVPETTARCMLQSGSN
jgi:hypothetical protein